MARTPRDTSTPKHHATDKLRNRVAGNLNARTLAVAGAGIALVGVGAATAAAGFAGTTASAASQYNLSHAVAADHAAAPHTQHAHARLEAKHAAVPATRHAHARLGAKHAPAPATKHAPAPAPATEHAHARLETKQAKRATGHGGHAANAHRVKQVAAPATKHAVHRVGRGAAHADTWAAVSRIAANHTYPQPGHGALPAADRLTPAGTSGPQTWMPITAARWDNARTIVRQALAKHMGVRSAVIAVATAMQESTLENISYGTSDSLGLFQQRPSCGWGTPTQILHPAYAADAFLTALHTYQAKDPSWAQQPLWQSAQGVQNSGFPYAYAKWEAQAAQLVAAATKHLI